MILVADQNRSLADMLVRRLRADGFQAGSAPSSMVVSRLVAGGGVTALVLDPRLPGDPYGTLGQIRGNRATTRMPVLVFSTTDGPNEAKDARNAGASEFLVKGRVSPAQLVERIRSLLSSGKAPEPAAPAASTEHGAYYLRVNGEGDAPRLASDLGLRPGMRCPDCGGQISLYLQRDFSRWGRWLFGTFGCLQCARKDSTVIPFQSARQQGVSR